MVSAIGSVTKKLVRKICLRRRLKFFITPNPLKSFVPFNFISQLSDRVTRIFPSIIIYRRSWKASSGEVLFLSRFDDDSRYCCNFNFRLSCRLPQESHRKDKALLRESILCRLVCHLENHFFSTIHL